MDKISKDEITSLFELFDSSDWKVLHLEIGDYEIYFSKDPNRRLKDFREHDTAKVAPSENQIKCPSVPLTGQNHLPQKDSFNQAELEVTEGTHIVRAPSLGTFYRAAKPGEDPYINLGDKVEANTEICLIEVMKLFTTVHASVEGVVREIFVNDGDLVEYDQVLFSISVDDA